MKTKRILALITAMLICFTLLPSYTLAASAVTFTAIDGKAGNNNENYEKLFDGKKSSGKKSRQENGRRKNGKARCKKSRLRKEADCKNADKKSRKGYGQGLIAAVIL